VEASSERTAVARLGFARVEHDHAAARAKHRSDAGCRPRYCSSLSEFCVVENNCRKQATAPLLLKCSRHFLSNERREIQLNQLNDTE